MKDLITTIGSITILMVFVMQFCFNQVTITRFLIGNKILENYENQLNHEEETPDWNDYKKQLAKCFDVEEKYIEIESRQGQFVVKIPVNNVIASGDFLGIDSNKNKAVYCGVINVNEESDNNHGVSDSNDDA